MKHNKKHKKIRRTALKVDKLIRARRGNRFPSKKIIELELQKYHKISSYVGSGKYKKVFHIKATEKDLALKVGKADDIKRDWKLYKYAKKKRFADRYFAKIYWHTTYCMLQKFGVKEPIPPEIQRDLKRRLNAIGLRDVGLSSDRNIRCFKGKFKIIDASFS